MEINTKQLTEVFTLMKSRMTKFSPQKRGVRPFLILIYFDFTLTILTRRILIYTENEPKNGSKYNRQVRE